VAKKIKEKEGKEERKRERLGGSEKEGGIVRTRKLLLTSFDLYRGISIQYSTVDVQLYSKKDKNNIQ